MKRLLNTILTMLVASLAVGCGTSGNKVVEDAKVVSKPRVNEVEVMELRRTDFNLQLLSNGKLRASRRSSLSFTSTGSIEKINVHNGSRVSSGQVLAYLDRPDLALSLASAEIALKKAELDMYDVLAGQGYKASDTLSVPSEILEIAKMRSGYVSAKNALKRAKLEYDGTILRSPYSGRVADIKYSQYDLASSVPFCAIIDDNFLDVDFLVMESEYSFLANGLNVRIIPFANQTKSITGKITSINPSVDKNGQVSVRATLQNDGTLIDGMNVKVIVERVVPDCLVVPRSAVVVRDNLDVLFTYTDDGHAHWTYVDIIQSNGDSHVVEANLERNAKLSEGETVIVSGNLNLADGSEVTLKD